MTGELPKGWCECRLEDLCHLENGEKQQNLNLPLLDAKFLRGRKDAEYRTSGVILYDNDVVILVDGENSGEVFTISQQGIMGSTFKKLHFVDRNIISYVLYCIKSNQALFRTNKKGAAIPHLDKELFKNLSILLPPLAEQERIVEKIEELFSEIDEGIKNLKIAQLQLKQYRQSVLKSAFEGKLTEIWRINNKCAKNKEIKEVDGIYSIPDTWVWCKLPSIGNLNRGKSKHRPRDDKRLFGGKYPFVQTGDIKKASKYLYDYTQTYNDFGLAQSKLWDENTLCITIAANIAETAILKIKACFPDSIVGFVKNEHLYSVELVEYYFRTIKERLAKYAPATAQKNINLSTLNEVVFPLAPLPEQERIVEEIEKRFEVTDEMEKAIQESLEDAQKLKQSILKKTFSGQLVLQNPDDEPSSVLLERIKALNSAKHKGKRK